MKALRTRKMQVCDNDLGQLLIENTLSLGMVAPCNFKPWTAQNVAAKSFTSIAEVNTWCNRLLSAADRKDGVVVTPKHVFNRQSKASIAALPVNQR